MGGVQNANAEWQRVITTAAHRASDKGELQRVKMLVISKNLSIVSDLVTAANGKAIGTGIGEPN